MVSICSALYIQMAEKNKADIAWKMDPLLRLTPPRRSATSILNRSAPHPPGWSPAHSQLLTVLSASQVLVQCSCKMSPLWMDLHTGTGEVQGRLESRVRIKRHGRCQGHGMLGGAHKGWLCAWLCKFVPLKQVHASPWPWLKPSRQSLPNSPI